MKTKQESTLLLLRQNTSNTSDTYSLVTQESTLLLLGETWFSRLGGQSAGRGVESRRAVVIFSSLPAPAGGSQLTNCTSDHIETLCQIMSKSDLKNCWRMGKNWGPQHSMFVAMCRKKCSPPNMDFSSHFVNNNCLFHHFSVSVKRFIYQNK